MKLGHMNFGARKILKDTKEKFSEEIIALVGIHTF
jgi:hypothetical protein